MPLVCARCGAPNPDGNNFCQNCGSPLAVAAPAAAQWAPPAAPPPVPAPGFTPTAAVLYPAQAPVPPRPDYQSPYYAPTEPQQTQRTPWMLVLGIIAALVLVMGACGVGIAIVVPKNSGNAATGPKLGTPAPPNASAKPTPGQTPASGQTLSIASLSVTVPRGFQVVEKTDDEVSVQTPNDDGLIQVRSARLSSSNTDQQLQQGVLALMKQKYPDASVCGSDDNVEINGPSGSIVKICFTLTQPNVPAVPAAAIYWLATNSAHNVYYEVDGVTRADNFDDFMDATSPFVDSVSWKLT